MKIEFGKRYINARGAVVKIISDTIDSPFYDYKGCNGLSYTKSGRFSRIVITQADLICEVDDRLYKLYLTYQITKNDFLLEHITLWSTNENK
jgi:hypothetical protein